MPLVAVIDDEESVRRALTRLLSAADLSACAFPSARSFLNEFDKSIVSCIVLDLHMPDMNGIDLQNHLRSAYPELAMRVIIITAHDDPGMRERCLAAGAAAYLCKPVEGAALIGAINRLMGRDLIAAAAH
jgi:FixJ family two-component response regulator